MIKRRFIKTILVFFILLSVTNICFVAGCKDDSVKLDDLQQAIIKGEAEIEEVAICKDIDEDYYLIEPTSIFPPETKSIFLTIRFKNFTPDDRLKVIWSYLEAERQLSTQEYSPQEAGSGNHYFNIKNPDFFQPGKYSAVLYFNGNMFKEIEFIVENP